MKRIISVILSLLLISSIYAAKTEKNTDLTKNLKTLIEKVLIGNKVKVEKDIIAIEDNTHINNKDRTESSL